MGRGKGGGRGQLHCEGILNWAFFRPNKDDHQNSLKKLVEGAKLVADPQSKVEPGMIEQFNRLVT